MSLSRDEESRLGEIEAFTRVLDPDFASRLNLEAALRQRDRRVVLCWCGAWVGSVMMLSGAGAARGLISIGAIVSIYGSILLLSSLWAAFRHRPHRPP